MNQSARTHLLTRPGFIEGFISVARFAGSVALDADQFRPFLVLVGVGVGLGEGVGVGVGLGDE